MAEMIEFLPRKCKALSSNPIASRGGGGGRKRKGRICVNVGRGPLEKKKNQFLLS
jgi:hypothetical protein